MGVAGAAQHGLSIKTVELTYDQGSHRVTRVAEASMIVQFGPGIFGHGGIRQSGLKLGMRIRRAHVSAEVSFTTGAATSATQAAPAPGQYTPLVEDPQVTQELAALFGIDRCRFLFWSKPNEQWIGFKIDKNSVPPPVAPQANDRLFFRTVLGRFDTNDVKDCEVLPIVAGFGNVPLQQHYALGIAVYTRGRAAGAPLFDTQVLGDS